MSRQKYNPSRFCQKIEIPNSAKENVGSQMKPPPYENEEELSVAWSAGPNLSGDEC
jgi:hypothetical protein